MEVDGDELQQDLFGEQNACRREEGLQDAEDPDKIGRPVHVCELQGENSAETDPRPRDAAEQLDVDGNCKSDFYPKLRATEGQRLIFCERTTQELTVKTCGVLP